MQSRKAHEQPKEQTLAARIAPQAQPRPTMCRLGNDFTCEQLPFAETHIVVDGWRVVFAGEVSIPAEMQIRNKHRATGGDSGCCVLQALHPILSLLPRSQPRPPPPSSPGKSFDHYTYENGVECRLTCYCKDGDSVPGVTFSSEGCTCNYPTHSSEGGFGKICGCRWGK